MRDERPSNAETALASDEWVERFEFSAREHRPNGSPLRWRHAGLEAVLSRADAADRLRAAARSRDAMVAYNAAIGLSNFEAAGVLPVLLAVARNVELKLPMRGAAIEALGGLTTSAADDALAALNADFGTGQAQSKGHYVPDLHADLIRAMARRPGNRHAAALRDAIASPAAAVRIEAARAYFDGRSAPRELVELTADESSAVRAAAIRALAASRHEEAQAHATHALSDYDLSVRLAAIEAMGVLPAAENVERLTKLAQAASDVIRAAAVKSLARQQQASALVRAAEDKSWRVRAAVAESLMAVSPDQRMKLRQHLLGDASLEVQTAVVHASQDWPLDEAIPFLLDAVESPRAPTRRVATELLKARWPPAADLSYAASSQFARVEAELSRLRQIWQESVNERRTVDDQRVPPPQPSEPALDSEGLAEVLRIVSQLGSTSVQERRAAARELSRRRENRVLPEQSLIKLAEFLERETDSLVLIEVLTLIADDNRPAAAAIAAFASSHPAADVRRGACGYFGRHPGAAAAQVLVNSLDDRDASVVSQAVRALATQSSRDIGNLSPLEKILTSSDGVLVVEAAAALVSLGSNAGFPALLRATYHRDPVARRMAAAALGQVLAGDAKARPSTISAIERREAIAELVRLLDDKGDIRRCALASLDQIGGEAPLAGASSSQPFARLEGDARANHWKEWLRNQKP